MNENIDLTKILDGCPKWTPFYSQVFGKVFFIRIETCTSGKYITFALNDHGVFSVDSKGRYATSNGSRDIECIIFPSKDQRDWSKFKTPTEKFDYNMLKPYDKVLVRNSNDFFWRCNFFSNFSQNVAYCVAYAWSQMIPYNDQTKHLVGTTNMPDEKYIWWGGDD